MLIVQHILNMIGGVAIVDPSVIYMIMKDAKKHILSDGVTESEPLFDLLHKYYTMHLLQIWGHVEDIASEEVGDVKATYEKTASNAGETKWFVLYQRELSKILGS